MDSAYDHIQEEVLRQEPPAAQPDDDQPEGNLNTELQEAYKSFSASPWGARLGGFLGSVRKQGESYYQGARQEAAAASEEALKGFSDLRSTLVSRARSISVTDALSSSSTSASTVTGEKVDPNAEGETEDAKKERSESDTLRESESLISRFRAEAAKRLKEIEKAEDAADEALLKFGTNIRNFLRDAVSVAPPSEGKDTDGNSKVLFESKDQDGKRVIHTTRFDAQLHVIHSCLDSFTKDPVSSEYEKWKESFSVEKKTDDIAVDLEKYEELRRAMEKLVPERVEYAQFWKRYYYLRMVIESEEQRRRDLLKGATLSPLEEVAWDEDSDDENAPATPKKPIQTPSASTTTLPLPQPTSASTPTASTIIPPPSSTNPPPPTTQTTNPSTSAQTAPTSGERATPAVAAELEPRKSQDQNSQPDSDASYDLVSGAASHAPGSPRDKGRKGEESEEEDWE
ncbi:hypothetical protein MMC30_002534 [Trapelia coarctata]|nr:hypothetical protein [Trapelia coarctata]